MSSLNGDPGHHPTQEHLVAACSADDNPGA